MTSLPLATAGSLVWRVPLVALSYLVLARIGFSFDIEPGFASSVWPVRSSLIRRDIAPILDT